MYKTTIPIKGMHCRSCELLIEDELKNLHGVQKVKVSHREACALMYHEKTINPDKIEAAVERAGYEVGFPEKKPWFSKDKSVYIDIVYSLIAVVILYILIQYFGLSSLMSTTSGKPTSLIAVLLIGLTAGLSTCMALIGGLVLGVSAKHAQRYPDATDIERFKPHLMFNIGRIVSYAVLGGIIGTLGSVFQISGMGLGLLTIGVAGVMLLLGLQLTGLFPRLEAFKVTLPPSIARALGISTSAEGAYSDKGAMIMGATTFFLPCGFTQAMQLYAMTTGNFVSGALIMATFAIGTAPGLLGVGGLTSVLKGVYAEKFFKFAGVVVVLLAFFNFQNGLNLTGVFPSISWPVLSPTTVLGAESQKIEIVDGKQVIRMTQKSSGYSPSTLTVVKGKPVKWIITSEDPNSCAASILASKIGIRTNLNPGENVFEFTPTEVGKIPFSCMMGMFRGTINVVESDSQVKNAAPPTGTVMAKAQPTTGSPGGCGGGGGGCGGCGGNARPPSGNPADAVKANDEGGVQIIKTTYTAANDISPNQFSVTAGKPVRMEIDVKDDGVGCMSSIMIPGYTRPQLLTAGELLALEFTPKEKGELLVTCAMGMARGSISVN